MRAVEPLPNRQLVERFLAYRETQMTPRRTITAWRSYLGRWADWLGEKSISDATVADLEDFIADTFGSRGYSSRKGVYIALRAFYKWAARRGVVATNVALDLDLPKKPRRRRPTFYKPEEVARILREFRFQDDQLICTVLARHGQRITPTITLRWRQVDFERALIQYDAAKDGAPITLPLDAETGRSLRAWYHLLGSPSGEEFVFPSRNHAGRHRGKDEFRESLRRACKRAGVQYRGPHELRRTLATTLLQMGEPLHVVSRQVLGHSNVQVTVDHYAGVEELDVAASIRALPY